jgi:HK97 family phage portal protein
MRYLFGGLWNPEKGIQRSGPGGYANDALQSVSDDRALQISAVYRCIRIIAETCAAMPLKAYQRKGTLDREELPRSHWLPTLIRKPNETMTGHEWREAMFAQAAGWGNSYSQIVPNAAGRATELWPYKVDRMTVDRLADRTLQYKYGATNGIPVVLPAGRTMHMRMFTVDGVMGLSPLGLARESLGLAVGAERYASSFYANGGRPSGVMTSDRLLNDKQREQIRREFGGLAEGGDESKRFWVLEAALKYEAITVNPEDMQMLQTRAFSIAEIARFFGVPLFLLGETEKSTTWGSGLEQMNLAFLIYTLTAYLERMEAIWNDIIIPPEEQAKIYVEHDLNRLLRADTAAKSAFYAAMGQNGIMTRNELRAREHLPQSDDPAANELTVQVNLTTLKNLGLTPAQPGGADPADELEPGAKPASTGVKAPTQHYRRIIERDQSGKPIALRHEAGGRVWRTDIEYDSGGRVVSLGG